MDKTLEQAITYIKAGDFEKGKQLLIQIIQQNPRDENAWLWMSRCVPVEQKKECFRRAIAINPNNELAQKALEKLSSSTLSSAFVLESQLVAAEYFLSQIALLLVGLVAR